MDPKEARVMPPLIPPRCFLLKFWNNKEPQIEWPLELGIWIHPPLASTLKSANGSLHCIVLCMGVSPLFHKIVARTERCVQ